MKRKMNLRAIVGAAVSAATLLALAPLGAANAANASLDLNQAKSKSTITIGVNAVNGAGTMEGHKFAAVKVGNYENAEGDASTGVLSSVAVSTVSGVKANAATALAAAKTDLSITPTTADAGYEDNPVGEVASKWLGWTGTDSSSNNGTVPNGWKGNLRTFVTELSNISAFQNLFTTSPAGTATATGASVNITDLTPGVYVVEDVTASGATGLTSTSHKNSIPMLVSTGIVMPGAAPNADLIYNTLGTQALGKVDLKNDAPQVKKSLDTDGGVTNDPSIGGTLHYKLESKVPLTTGYSHYVFTMVDTPSQRGLSYGSITGIHVGAPAPGGRDLATSEYTVNDAKYTTPANSPSTQYLTIDLSPSVRSLTYGDSIVVRFTMTVNDEATGGALENGVTLGYSSDTNNQPSHDKGDVDPSTGQVTNCVPVSSTCQNGTVTNDKTEGSTNTNSKTYFRHFNVIKEKKVDGSALTGAKFTVTASGSTTPIKFLQDGNGSYKKSANQSAASATDKLSVYDSTSGVANDTVAGAPTSNGELMIDGLADGVYTLAEDTAPAGYSSTFKPSIEVSVGAGSADNVSGFANKGDTWGLVEANGKKYVSSATNTLNDVSWNTTGTDHSAPNAGAIVVKNVNSVSQLPLTGGAGAILVLLVVVVLGILTATLIFVRRRLGANDNANAGAAIKA
ncbi:isopeptide-forming domain-containing fimbrial protein [Bifidobacterium sp. ESL0728]|uniref:isopeptide-forming domain-containing fimbrial protein n=1 Tax=Bifidobacterium sp. ESL0728 TaxID=2983220 RepID=UPI0023F79C59|nr:isopeptide-forming domain-containing fimbrial protein [Bifidobacterium sp. ESL0728]WEV58925.1 isopeptide-forming domain-containing fimbrial protein [Bifidobacterium sp. ESL0728]